MTADPEPQSTARLYAEALRLGAAARDYFDGDGVAARAELRPEARLAVATESLRATARLVEIIAALLARDAGAPGAPRPRDLAPVPVRLGGRARAIVGGVRDLYLQTFAGEVSQ